MTKPVKAWAIIGRSGKIHADKIAMSPAKCWGLLADEPATLWDGRESTVNTMKRAGYRCIRVTVEQSK